MTTCTCPGEDGTGCSAEVTGDDDRCTFCRSACDPNWRQADAGLPTHIEAALADPHSQYDAAGELLPHLLAFGPPPQSTQDGDQE